MDAKESSISEIVEPKPAENVPAPQLEIVSNEIPQSTKPDIFASPIWQEPSKDNQAESINTAAKPVSAEDLIEKRGRGRPKGAKNKSNPFSEPELNAQGSAVIETSAIPEQAIPEIPVTDYQALASLTVAMGTSTLAMVFGPEWQPEDENERLQLTIAIAKYMEAQQVKDIPPGVLLTIVLLTYSTKRFRAPSTRQKINAAWYWVKNKFARKKV